MLPVTAACASCGLDGWGQQPVIPIQKMNREIPSSLMECSVCYEIIHPDCVAKLVSVYLLLDLSSCSSMYSDALANEWPCERIFRLTIFFRCFTDSANEYGFG